jgi:hypothetical protein
VSVPPLPPAPPAVIEEVRRLTGQTVDLGTGGAYVIRDVAGEGRPLVGKVERRGPALWLVPTDADAGTAPIKLSGALAHPRIAGPGYKVWVLGTLEQDGSLRARRLGVLARPAPPAKGTP